MMLRLRDTLLVYHIKHIAQEVIISVYQQLYTWLLETREIGSL